MHNATAPMRDWVAGAWGLVWYWGPLVLWLAAIFVFSGDTLSAHHTAGFIEPVIRRLFPGASAAVVYGVHVGVRKIGHVLEYALLTLLAFRAVRSGRTEGFKTSWAFGAFFIGAGYSLLDELHQSFVPSRTGSISDAVIDMTGCFAAVVCVAWVRRRWTSTEG